MERAPTAPAAAHDHRPSAVEYERRRPEGTVLHRVVSEHWGAFVEHAEEQGRRLPSFVQREVGLDGCAEQLTVESAPRAGAAA